mmetsp:Transcript_10711/g.15667  ORF Transcript_10711/g.15667 Transcript_10711/m.15667 type:complete len:326 (-) Transcript_10711:105-1082(-)
MKRVLKEEQWLDGMEYIITRDYYPSIPDLHIKINEEEAKQTKDQEHIDNAKAISSTYKEKPEMLLREEYEKKHIKDASSDEKVVKGEWDSSDDEDNDDRIECKKRNIDTLTLTGYVNNYTSEDNDSYAELHRKDKAKHLTYIKKRFGVQPQSIAHQKPLSYMLINDHSEDKKKEKKKDDHRNRSLTYIQNNSRLLDTEKLISTGSTRFSKTSLDHLLHPTPLNREDVQRQTHLNHMDQIWGTSMRDPMPKRRFKMSQIDQRERLAQSLGRQAESNLFKKASTPLSTAASSHLLSRTFNRSSLSSSIRKAYTPLERSSPSKRLKKH